ncbi:MAG: TonB-dependent receptor [Saprospiraceae bacterium]|nr:TonB-dependent receptor [Saprospiraceae bacterium]
MLQPLLRTFCLRRHLFTGLFLFVQCLVFCQSTPKFTISGYISDAKSGERLIGATVVDKRSGQGAVTNTYGFFSLTLPKDSVTLLASYIGFQAQGIQLYLNANVEINLPLESSALLKEVEVVAQRYERIESRAQMSRIDVPIQQIKNVPALLGETDVLKVLQLLPGVSGGGEGQSGIYVRGGGADQNLILLDGVPVYNASHLFGFFSVFNADAIKDVTLTKGGFPARYGGRLSSVIEINMKEGNENEFHGEGSIGIVASKLTLEGPIKKGKSSFLISARRTYIDLLARPLIKAGFRSDGSEGVAGYYFYDLNAKVNYRLSNKDRLYLSFYTGKDKFYLDLTEKDQYTNSKYEFSLNTGLGWGNLTTAARWNHVINPKLFANTTVTYSRYNFNTNTGATDRETFTDGTPNTEYIYEVAYVSGIDDIAAKLDFDYAPNPAHLIKFGANAIFHNFDPGEFNTRIKDSDTNSDQRSKFGQTAVDAPELAAYIEDDWKISDRLRTNYGLHVSSFIAGGKAYFSAQPRFNIRYLLNHDWALKGAFSTMRQYIHLLTNETIGLPTDLWLPTTKTIKPQDAWQVALGAAKTLGKDYEFSVEAYYKKMKNVIAFREGASLFQFTDWQTRVTQGDGTAYGTEFFIQKKTGRFSGWLGYTLSWAYRQFDDLNQGRKFFYKYDRRHDFEVVGSYKISPRVRVSATWVYSTGNVTTLGNSRYLNPTAYSRDPVYYFNQTTNVTERNNFRLNAYHRLDVGIDFTKKKRHHERTWSFGAYNSYNRNNPFFLFLSESGSYDSNGNYKNNVQLKQASLFPIIPYFNYSFKF